MFSDSREDGIPAGTFEWDVNKNRSNVTKHGIDFADALRVFSDPSAE